MNTMGHLVLLYGAPLVYGSRSLENDDTRRQQISQNITYARHQRPHVVGLGTPLSSLSTIL